MTANAHPTDPITTHPHAPISTPSVTKSDPFHPNLTKSDIPPSEFPVHNGKFTPLPRNFPPEPARILDFDSQAPRRTRP